jgi:thiol-disulfide isomerase/thioredoxin
VQLVRLDAGQEDAKPIDVEAGDGYFTIPGLKRGGQYKLIARTKIGNKMLAGITIRQAPDPLVVIQVREEFATSSIPPLPEPGEKKEAKPAASSGLDNRAPTTAIWTPAPAANTSLPGARAPAEIEVPARLTVPVPTPAAAPNALAPGVASAPSTGWPPTLQIGPKRSTTPASSAAPPQPPPLPGGMQGRLPPLVPSCVVLGKQVQTLALKDVDDQTWDFYKDRRGKVVLLDFWMPNCAWCRRAMPTLAQMQTKYGPQGLEVVGVYVARGPVHDQALAAKQTCYQAQTNYRQVLGQDDKTKLCEQFRVQNYPTAILLDAQGRVLWRHDGVPEPAMLEKVLQQHLANRAF